MASYSVEDFVGNGVLKEVMEYLVSEGWDDVPTLKMMNAEDMEAHNLSTQQRDALEIRTYLHNRSLMEYADNLEASGKSLPELLSMDPRALSSQYGMKRGHVARFIDRSMACGVPIPPNTVLPARRKMNRTSSGMSEFSMSSRDPTTTSSPSPAPSRSYMTREVSFPPTSEQKSVGIKGIVAAAPTDPRCCGLIKPAYMGEDVAPYSMIEGISVKKLTPEYKVGMEAWSTGELKTPPPMRAGDLWVDKPAVVLCIRRPGCLMCRAEAHQIYARKPIFDALGFQLIVVLHEFIDPEVKEFWPHYWGGIVAVDTRKDFFKALGGGKLPKEGFVTGFLFNKNAIENYKRAKATGIPMNYKGEGTIKGGLFVIGSGKSGVAYQFVERNFGDSAPLAEVIEVCNKLQKNESSFKDSFQDFFGYSKEKDGYAKWFAGNIASGSAAGATTSLFLYHLDYARTRLGMDAKNVLAGSQRHYKGLFDVYKKTLASDGVVGLYRGFSVSIVGITLYRGLYFGIYDTLKPVILVGSLKGNFIVSFMLGWSVTSVAGILAYPFDTVRRRMMMTSGEVSKYRSPIHAFKQIVQLEGVTALFRGVTANMLLGVAGAGVLAGYDQLQMHIFGNLHQRATTN